MTQRTLAELLRHHRLTAVLKQDELAGRINYDTSTISRVERGERSPTPEYLQRFIQELHLSDAEGEEIMRLHQEAALPALPIVKKTWPPHWVIIIGIVALLGIGVTLGIILALGQTIERSPVILAGGSPEVAIKLEKTAKSEVTPATATPLPQTATPILLPPTTTLIPTAIPPTVTPTPPNTPTNPPTPSPPTSLSAPVEASRELLAVIIGFEPVVEVKRGGTNFLVPAAFAMPLFRGDVVNTYRGATAKIICENGQIYELPPEKNLTVYCQDTPDTRNLDQVPPELGEPLVNPAEPFTPTLTFTQTRASRVAWQQLPLLIIPRNTVVTDTKPTFIWQSVSGANGYRLSVNPLGEGATWLKETAATTLPYPAAVSPLALGSYNSITLTTLTGATPEDKSLLQVMDQANQAELAKGEAEIRALALDEVAKTYLLAQLYRQRGLRAAAITQLQALTLALTGAKSAYLWQQLGDLYFESGLYARAEENYRTALSAAEAAADPGAQAAAHAGLARVVYILEETGPAIEHLTSAENLYKAAGDRKRAEIVAAERAKLEE